MSTKHRPLYRAIGNDEAMRDFVRDFCRVNQILAEQEARFAATSTLSFAELDALLGQDMRQGVLWRLKDNTHQHLRARDAAGVDAPLPAVLLDWCVGYVFHECVKLREDAFLQQHYATHLTQLRSKAPADCTDICDNLLPFANQTTESTRREIARIRAVLDQAQQLCVRCLAAHGDNGPLARFLVEEAPLARAVFGEGLDALYAALYGAHPEQRFVRAARACLEGGRPRNALDALDALDAHYPPNAQTAAVRDYAATLRPLAEAFDPTTPLPDLTAKGAHSGSV